MEIHTYKRQRNWLHLPAIQIGMNGKMYCFKEDVSWNLYLKSGLVKSLLKNRSENRNEYILSLSPYSPYRMAWNGYAPG